MVDTTKIKNKNILKVPEFDMFIKSLTHNSEYKKSSQLQNIDNSVTDWYFGKDLGTWNINGGHLQRIIYRYVESFFNHTDKIVSCVRLKYCVQQAYEFDKKHSSEPVDEYDVRQGKFKIGLFIDYLLSHDFKILKKDNTDNDNLGCYLLFKHNTLDLILHINTSSGIHYFNKDDKRKKKDATYYGNVHQYELECRLFYTSDLKDNFETFVDLINEFESTYIPKIKDVEKRAELNIVGSDRDGYRLREKNIYSKDSKYTDLDLHYGEGFEEKYNILIDRLIETKKGLVLFHGEPGTGKTQTLRNIILKLSDHKKIIYVPSNMVESILDPSFMTFLSEVASEIEEEHKNILMIIEDAENLIVKRVGIDSARVSNILNSADGLLNDYLNLQLIITFNADMNDIDEAILREERLIADFKFTTIPKDRQIKLMEKLGIKNYDMNYDYNTLAEIYSLDKNRRTIRFNSDSLQSSNKFGFTE